MLLLLEGQAGEACKHENAMLIRISGNSVTVLVSKNYNSSCLILFESFRLYHWQFSVMRRYAAWTTDSVFKAANLDKATDTHSS